MSEITNQLITTEVEIKFKLSEKIIVPAKR